MNRERALDDLSRRLPARIGLPGAPIYEAARRVFAPAGRRRRPLAAVRPADRDEVAAVLAWATENKIAVSPRSGGHSFDGFSVQDGAVLLDLGALRSVSLADDGRLVAMPGATNLDVAKAIGASDRAVPLGDCPTVALGGLIAGGGFGYCSRHLGLTCDTLVEATLVRPNGSVVRVAADENPDLFWACRGGGGSVGVITDMVLQTRRVPALTSVTLTWRWTHIREGLALYTTCLGAGPNELDLKLKMRTTGADRFLDTASSGPEDAEPGVPLVHIDGDYIGPRDEAIALLAPLLSHPALIRSDIRARSFHDAELDLIPLGVLVDPAPETLRPTRIASDFVSVYPDAAAAEALIRFVEALQSAPDLHGGAILIEPTGGRVRTPVTPSAFVHRDATLLMQYELFHKLPLPAAAVARHDDLLREVREGLGSVLTGGRYVNYADRLDTPEHWWRGNLERLQQIVTSTNPDGVLVSRLSPPGSTYTS